MEYKEDILSEKKQNWYFTFGCSYYHKDDVVKIWGTWDSARRYMSQLFGDHWAFQYTEEEIIPEILRYKYTIIEP